MTLSLNRNLPLHLAGLRSKWRETLKNGTGVAAFRFVGSLRVMSSHHNSVRSEAGLFTRLHACRTRLSGIFYYTSSSKTRGSLDDRISWIGAAWMDF